jgi:hypothetical protein
MGNWNLKDGTGGSPISAKRLSPQGFFELLRNRRSVGLYPF